MTGLRIPVRFNGPPGSANGGYTCGLVADLLGGQGPCEVSLRAPPALDRDLEVEREGQRLVVRDGPTVVAQGRRAELELDPGPAVTPQAASEASAGGLGRWAAGHPFPTCVVCGPDREPGDGFEIFPAPIEEGARFAAGWVPHGSLAADDETVRPECVWAALDCPTSAPLANYGEGPPVVLARLTASLDSPVAVGEPHALVSWALGRDGRKREAACVLFDSSGRPRARARALWIELRES
ncbi:MAG: hypothetical protein WKF29_00015 [Thermoleophilaceae bacterium]|nr:hypothetical protein [Thermoleophilaceae bacterium]